MQCAAGRLPVGFDCVATCRTIVLWVNHGPKYNCRLPGGFMPEFNNVSVIRDLHRPSRHTGPRPSPVQASPV